ncbi:MAG TPA: hypothetical protein PLY84_01160 [Bacilli bacterium]|nr:hypothetical protein [Bacilli bacterium]HQD92456.1 hypothetical protein [Bacilli bacterium]
MDMFLSLLSKEEKFYFIDLLQKLMFVDGEASELELQIINRFRHEMGDDVLKYKKSNLSLEKLIEYFAGKSKATRNLVLLNLIAASLYDEWYSVEEHFLIEEIQKAFDISDNKKQELMKIVYAERDLREKAKRILVEP